MNKIFICSITKIYDKQYTLNMIAFYCAKNGFDYSQRIMFDKINLNEDLSWEKNQLEHYFEYETKTPHILCNNHIVLKKLFKRYKKIFI